MDKNNSLLSFCCLSLTVSENEHRFTCLLAIYICFHVSSLFLALSSCCFCLFGSVSYRFMDIEEFGSLSYALQSHLISFISFLIQQS